MATQARSIASLTISFGLVAIPVKLYSATISSERISFNLLRQKDGSRVKQQYIAVNDGKPVERSEMVKGYEFAKDQYVMFSPEELKALEDATTHAIDIGNSCRSSPWIRCISTAPTIWRRTRAPPSPTPCSPRRFARHSNARWDDGYRAARSTSSVIRALEDGLAMHQLHFKAEIRDIKELGVEAAPVSEPELKLARQLIDQLGAADSTRTNTWTSTRPGCRRPSREKSTARKSLWRKARYRRRGGNVIDLMEALRASIDARGSKAADIKQRKAPKRAAARASSRKSARR